MTDLKIKGIKMNHLNLILNGISVGELDADHDLIKVNRSKKEFEEEFPDVDLSFEVADYYNEISVNDDFEASATTNYTVQYEEDIHD